MTDSNHFEVIIAGGSYSGLAAGMALGRSLRRVLIIDSGMPCNRQTPYSHNFLTQDGQPPAAIAAAARAQVERYDTVRLLRGRATEGLKTATGFEIHTEAGERFTADRLVFATGIRDLLPDIPGLAACWGISVLHCPYCHGYEVSNQKTGVLGNGDGGFELAMLVSNWTKDLTLYTNGRSALTAVQADLLARHDIAVRETEIDLLAHDNGHLQAIVFRDGARAPVRALYARVPFVPHCAIPEALGCERTEEGYLKVDASQRTSVPGIYACGDDTSRLRTVAHAVATGAAAGMMLNKELVLESFGYGAG